MTPQCSRNRSARLFIVPLLAILLLSALNAWADVRDPTGLFSPQTIQQANATIQKIRQQTGKDVVVEVFPEIPSDFRGNYNPAQKATFFNTWMQSRARQLGVNGIYILINRNPSNLDVGVGAETARRAFTLADRNQLASTMLGSFRNKQYDQGLQAGLNFVQQRMQANLGQGGGAKPQYLYQSPSASPSSGGKGLSWGWWLLIIGGILLLFSWFRRRSRSQPYAYGGPGGYANRPGPMPPNQEGYQPGGGSYPPGGGGGFGRGLLGGVLGGAAGGWLYDRLFRGGQSSAYGSPPPAGGSPGEQPLPPDQGQGFEGTGGSFDQPSGGDIGGGGDWGGGGGDIGGGGGDDQSGGTF
ncbi:MAG TPA: TPM domain-containing protein [Tepidisphaeraceae bacterium]|nr:TPM domain-containing protein [Tepidisphaeraceae bacterium]